MNLLRCDTNTLLARPGTEPQHARDLRALIGWSHERFERALSELTDAESPPGERTYDEDYEAFIRHSEFGG